MKAKSSLRLARQCFAAAGVALLTTLAGAPALALPEGGRPAPSSMTRWPMAAAPALAMFRSVSTGGSAAGQATALTNLILAGPLPAPADSRAPVTLALSSTEPSGRPTPDPAVLER